MKSIKGWFWRLFVRRAALRQGFIDPVAVLSRLRRFAHPSEVDEPLELIRAGLIFHARGLLNTRAIQHNLDWVWPYWVERQFDPEDVAFIPRAFSLTHVNLAHRNWTATGLPGMPVYPIVDPGGLVTPFYDGWSIDAWIITEDRLHVFPSKQKTSDQSLALAEDRLEIETRHQSGNASLSSVVYVSDDDGQPVCNIQYTGRYTGPAWLAVTLRPANPEGVSLIEKVEQEKDRCTWHINGRRVLQFCEPADRSFSSNYLDGDVLFRLPDGIEKEYSECSTGMATAASLYRMEPGLDRTVNVRVFLAEDETLDRTAKRSVYTSWKEVLSGSARLNVPDRRCMELYDQAVYTLILLSPDDVYPGPYTYKRFWFRDAAFLLNALLCAGFTSQPYRALSRYPGRQKVTGFFHSQDGEWDSNGEALWIMNRYVTITGSKVPDRWLTPIKKGAHWILRKRSDSKPHSAHAGLMPPGFSAEHLGPNDYYYWDNFWSVAGLLSAAELLRRGGDHEEADRLDSESAAYLQRISDTLAECRERLGRPAMPASPYRRLDAGAIGSLSAGYPLQLWPGDDPRLCDTAEFLMKHCFVKGGFFQDMIHSGINAYLTLHIAQILLRSGDPRFMDLVNAVADLASPTGQWPEAIHPRTLGGCMGDGHHAWASAEWVMMLRNMFVREEGRELVIGSGIIRDWQSPGSVLSFGPGLTTFGSIEVEIELRRTDFHVSWEARWHNPPTGIVVAFPGQETVKVEPVSKGEASVRRIRKV